MTGAQVTDRLRAVGEHQDLIALVMQGVEQVAASEGVAFDDPQRRGRRHIGFHGDTLRREVASE